MNIEYLLSLNEIEFYEYKTFEAPEEFEHYTGEKSEFTLKLELYKMSQMREDLKNADSDFRNAKRQYAKCKNIYNILKTPQTKLNLTLAGKTYAQCEVRAETLKSLV